MKPVRAGMTAAGTAVAAGSVLATVLSAHSAVNARLLRKPPAVPPEVREPVSICIPARDEADDIVACLTSVLASRMLTDMEVLVLDDASTDSTAELVAAVAETDGRVRLLRGDDALAPGWLGKPYATERLRREATGAVLVFVDADVRLRPDAVASGVAVLRRHGFSMVCPYPRQIAVGVGERLVQPLLQWLWLTFLPLRVAERLRPAAMVAANGQFMVVDAQALHAVDGFAAVRGEVLDDVALARAFKRSGLRVAVVDGTELAECRMYNDWASLVEGYSKSLWSASSSPAGAAGFAALLSAAYLVPPLAVFAGLFRGRRRLALTGMIGYASGVAGRTISARRTGGRPGDAVLHPLSVVTLIGLLWRSWRGRRSGSLSWKGRSLGGAGVPH